jgi:glycosyltransferase involved in cell wall biosynthesis
MKIAVIIPTFNRPHYLYEALNSIILQKRAPDEVIVVDDSKKRFNSNKKKFLELFGERFNLKYIKNLGKKGACGARNFGAEESACEVLAFLDDDDFWGKDYLKVIEKEFNKGKNVVCSSFYEVTSKGIFPEKNAPKKLSVHDFFLRNPGVRGSNLAVSKKIFLKINGFDESLPSMNDLDFGIRLSKERSIKYSGLSKRLVYFRNHLGKRLSSTKSYAKRLGVKRFYSKYSSEMSLDEKDKYKRHVYYLWKARVE